eukprot:g3291.t1
MLGSGAAERRDSDTARAAREQLRSMPGDRYAAGPSTLLPADEPVRLAQVQPSVDDGDGGDGNTTRLIRQNRRLLDELEQKRRENHDLLKRLDQLTYQQKASADRILQQEEQLRWLRQSESRADAMNQRCEELQGRVATMRRQVTEHEARRAEAEMLRRRLDVKEAEVADIRRTAVALEQRAEELSSHASQQHHLLGEANRVISLHQRQENKAIVQRRHLRERLIGRIVAHMANHCLALAMNTWRTALLRIYRWEGKQARKRGEEMQLLCDEENQHCAVRGVWRCVNRWSSGRVGRAWSAWCTETRRISVASDRERARQTKLSSIARHMSHVSMAKGYRTWNGILQAARAEEARAVHRRSLILRSVAGWRSRKLRLALTTWTSVIRALAQERRNEKTKGRYIRTAVMRMTHTAQNMGFRRWCGFCSWVRDVEAERQRQRGLMQRTILHALNRKQSVGFKAWCRTAHSLREQEKQRKQQMRSVALKMLKSYLTMAWNSFHHVIMRIKKAEAEKAAQERQMKRIMLKMLQRQLSLGWHGWDTFVKMQQAAEAELEAQQHTMRSIMLKMMKRQLSAGWLAFCRVVREEQKRRAAAQGAAEEQARAHERRIKVVKGVLGRIFHQRQSAGLQAWKKVVQTEREQAAIRRTKMRSVALKMLKSYLSMAWNSFASAIRRLKKAEAEKAAKERQMKRVMLKMLQKQFSLGWQGWLGFVKQSLAVEAERERQRHVMTSVMMKMLKRQLSVG